MLQRKNNPNYVSNNFKKKQGLIQTLDMFKFIFSLKFV